MRLWHKNLIKVLPKQQFLGQIRELTAICKDIQTKGKTNHILINKIMEYDLSHLYTYCLLVLENAKQRKINIKEQTLNKWWNTFNLEQRKIVDIIELFGNWHNDRYLIQCFYNLQEKADCGGITEKEFNLIKEEFKRI